MKLPTTPVSKARRELGALLEREGLPADVRLALEGVQRSLDKELARTEFRVQRTLKDKEIATNLLDQTIADLEANVRALELSHEAMEQFMYVASHDLKTPLRSIGSFASLIRRRYGDRLPEGAEEYFGFILDNARAMNRVIDDLVAYNRAGIADHVEELCLNELGREVLLSLSADVEAAGAEVVLHDLGRVRSARSALSQLLQNLIGNALVYREHSRPCRVEVWVDRGGPVPTLCVRDNGVGLDEDYRDKAFEPFKRVGDLSRAGTGMGLAICRRIARKIGGDITYSGEVGVGTCFFVGIGGAPRVAAVAVAAPQP